MSSGETEAAPGVQRLVGNEGGLWRVLTLTSEYLFDLDAMTVTRKPGPQATPTMNDVTRPIETITTCKVGSRGYWTMKAEGELSAVLENFWQLSTHIRAIEQVTAGSAEPPEEV